MEVKDPVMNFTEQLPCTVPQTDISTNGPIWYIVQKAQWQWLVSISTHPYPSPLLWCPVTFFHLAFFFLLIPLPPSFAIFPPLCQLLLHFCFPVFACFLMYRILHVGCEVAWNESLSKHAKAVLDTLPQLDAWSIFKVLWTATLLAGWLKLLKIDRMLNTRR